MKLLLVEDDKTFGQAFKAFLTAKGHTVVWLRAVESLDPFTAVDGNGTKVAVEVSDFQLALVDGQLEESTVSEGAAVAAKLLAQGCKVLGISSQNGPNQEMVRLGALAAANKAIAFVAIICEMITVDDIVNGGIDGSARWQSLDAEVRSNSDARHRAEAYLKSID
jgi:CheY-like chemotaxis protein